MASIGSHLRELRQRRGLSLEEISRATRVAPRYLEALEADQFSALPAPVFTRGFIRAYCHAVGEAPDEALARYDHRDGATSTPARQPVVAAPAAPAADREPRTRSAIVVSAVLVVILGIALFAVAIMTQPGRDERVERRVPAADEASASAPTAGTGQPSGPMAAGRSSPIGAVTNTTPPVAPSSPIAAASPAAPSSAPRAPSSTSAAPSSASPAPSPPSPAPTPAPATSSSPTGAGGATTEASTTGPAWLPNVQAATGGVASPYRLVARVSEPTWIRVRTDDGRSTEETIPAGQTREWLSNRPFVLTLGNAGGVTLELNGRTLPPLGPSGAVISRIVLPPQ